MVDRPTTMKYDLFPTEIVRSKCPSITLQDKQEMMDCTDWMIEQGLYDDNELTPKYHTKTMLFRDDAPAVWQKLREEFYQACRNYLETVDSFVQNQDVIEFTGSGAWTYKGWESLNEKESNPWHDHNPAFLSGVYYLHDPGDGTHGGTEFHDPRKSEAHGTRMQEILPMENTWIIFPGWLAHKSRQLPLEEPRYVISANLFVKVRY
jgi:hypothetical protein|tara:strand:+ start:1870 stop:2487 length:618 start_codon:yes stop_codon:yes gene_type:complete